MIQLSYSISGEHIVIQLSGDLDIESTELIEQELIPMLEKYQSIRLDFEKVLFVDSSGIGILMFLVQTLQEQNKEITICNVTAEVMEVLKLLQIPEILGESIFA
ncbi:STAS domain-containing protein [Heyndrickxia ginsengihumi]|uniref:Anti-sigma factor antagonist n=1 Tax=Heyndrickxia ginsengihumi TaxID=363870 RepID=A0A0A6VDL1_9BACI|nr:STAS domain-containing protein [Heyndrickxia ginsengihumi]KHD86330.1 hypothetical protein NG54_04050 [Heyndrickxia ginsengihumi]MBE6185546.1 STAS domain-containing protein [Bacillus sp. (in: firmicutes)]MCM3023706.1 STAS domain-containing protein [Heyndrickxia ginsengihumi]NEY19404.1 STAS domain-containing protein [Heyndrickxia ginsengihumi]